MARPLPRRRRVVCRISRLVRMTAEFDGKITEDALESLQRGWRRDRRHRRQPRHRQMQQQRQAGENAPKPGAAAARGSAGRTAEQP